MEVSSTIRNSCITKCEKKKNNYMFKVAIIPLMFPPGENCGEFKSMRLAGGVSAGPLTVDSPEALFTSVGVESWGEEVGEGWAAAVLPLVTSMVEL